MALSPLDDRTDFEDRVDCSVSSNARDVSNIFGGSAGGQTRDRRDLAAVELVLPLSPDTAGKARDARLIHRALRAVLRPSSRGAARAIPRIDRGFAIATSCTNYFQESVLRRSARVRTARSMKSFHLREVL
jgi:hypothetical protein